MDISKLGVGKAGIKFIMGRWLDKKTTGAEALACTEVLLGVMSLGRFNLTDKRLLSISRLLGGVMMIVLMILSTARRLGVFQSIAQGAASMTFSTNLHLSLYHK